MFYSTEYRRQIVKMQKVESSNPSQVKSMAYKIDTRRYLASALMVYDWLAQYQVKMTVYRISAYGISGLVSQWGSTIKLQ